MRLKICFAILFLSAVFSCEKTTANDSIKSSINKSAAVGSPEEQLNNLLLQSKKFVDADDKRSVPYAEKALELSKALNSDSKQAAALNLLGKAWKTAGDNAKSGEYLFRSLTLYHKLNMPAEHADVLKNIGETYRAAGSLDQSMIYLYAALSYFSKTADEAKLAETYNRLAATTYELFINAAEYNQLILKLENKDNNSNIIQLFDSSLRKKYNLTIYFVERANYYSQRNKLEDIAISTQIIKAAVFNSVFQFNNALKEYANVIATILKSGTDAELPLVYINLATAYFSKGDYNEAYTFAKKGYDLALNKDIKIYLILSSGLLGKISQKQGNLDEAFKYIELQYALREQYYRSDIELRINSIRYNFELDKRQTEINYRRLQNTGLFILFSFILLTALVFFIYILKKNKSQSMLNQLLKNKNQIISEQNKQLEVSNKEKDKLFSIIAHDLRSPMNGFLGLTSIMADEIEALSTKEIQRMSVSMHTAALNINRLLENLLEWSKMQRGTTFVDPVNVALKSAIKKNIDLMKPYAVGKGIEITSKIPNHLIVFADIHLFDTVIRNLLSNAIKFSERGKTVHISAAENGHKDIIISVSDKGIGMNTAQLSAIFEMEATKPGRKGTAGEPSSGLGLLLCKEFAERNGGKIWAESKEDQGSTFFVSVPSSN